MTRITNIKIPLRDDDVSGFYISLYFEALKRIDRVNDIKVSFLKLSLLSTFAFFAWILTDQKSILILPTTFKYIIWLIPFLFNFFGFIYNLNLEMTAKRYADFTRFLVSKTDNLRHLYDEFLAERKPFRFPMSKVFWILMCLLSLSLGIAGANTVSMAQ